MTTTIPHPDRPGPNIKLGWHDRILVDGAPYNCFSCDAAGAVLRRTDGVIEYRWFRQSDLRRLLARHLMVIETNFFRPVKRRGPPAADGTQSR